jgi:hypothetical protein
MTSWEFELDGKGNDLRALMSLAPACNCTVQPGPDGYLWLGGAKFDDVDTSEKALEEAQKALDLLNGLARLENPKHSTVGLFKTLLRDGRIEYFKPYDTLRRSGSTIQIWQPPALGAPLVIGAPVDPVVARRRERIVSDPELTEIVEVFADEITWQRLRVAFEKFNALVGKGDNALVQHGYATQEELTRFKANIEDPRHSGVEAVHGVHKGPLKGSKMTESEGFEFIVRLFNKYLGEHL